MGKGTERRERLKDSKTEKAMRREECAAKTAKQRRQRAAKSERLKNSKTEKATRREE